MTRHGRGFPLGSQFISTPIGDPLKVAGVAEFRMEAVGIVRVGGGMPQFGRPSTDTVNEGWTEDDGTSTTIFDQIDEPTPDDADYIRSALAPTNDVYATKLAGFTTDPQRSDGHTIRFRYGKDVAAGATISLLIQLRQGYVSEVSQGTLIATVLNVADVGVFPIAGEYTLTDLEADAITDYSNLFLRHVANQL